MSNYDINNNPLLVKDMIENAKKVYVEYLKEHPDSLIPIFEKELRELGFEFELSDQVKGFLPMNRTIILPIAIKYYKRAKLKNEKSYFMGLFQYKGFDEVVPILIEDFYIAESLIDRWEIGSILYTIKSKYYKNDYLKIIANSEYGNSRQMVVLLVGKLKIEEATPILIKLLDNDEVRGHAIAALGDYKREEFRNLFERFQDNKSSYIRKEALKALKKLDVIW